MPNYCNKPCKTANRVKDQAPAWKTLLAQALQTTRIPPRRSGLPGLLEARRYIYRALQNAGIENRSPFSLWQIFQIQIKSNGEPERIRQYSIEALSALQSPSLSFNHRAPLIIKILAASGLLITLLPQTATTYLAPPVNKSILKIATLPWPDQETERSEWPLQSDYQLAAFEPAVIQPADSMTSLADASWIKQQRDSAYTLQLLSVSDPAHLQPFCRQYKICDHAAIYTSQLNGKSITRLLYGNYRNHQAAKQAKTRLPKGLSGWARQFGQIKQSL